VNIAVKVLEIANTYDKLILVTADSDQVPAVRLLLASSKLKFLGRQLRCEEWCFQRLKFIA
jgi:hypothetical protein